MGEAGDCHLMETTVTLPTQAWAGLDTLKPNSGEPVS